MSRVRDLRLPPRALRTGGVLALAALVALAALRSRALLGPLRDLASPQPGWLALALLAELGALAAYAGIVRRLLALGGVRTGVAPLLRPTVAGIALGASLPGGQAASGVYWYRQLRRTGADGQLAGLAMVGAALAGFASLAALLVAGVAAAGASGPLAGARMPILAGVGASLVTAALLRGRVARTLRAVVDRLVPALADRLAVSGRALAAIGALALVNWLLDCACLYLSLRAVGATVPLHGLLLTFALGMLVASIPLLPGGGGTVEATLAVGFAAFGGAYGSVLAGILLFRLVNCWGLVPVGWTLVALDGLRLPALPRLSLARRRLAAA